MQISRKTVPYIRVLGFNERGRYIISEVARQNPKLEIVTSVKKYLDSCNNRNLQLMLSKDIWSTNVYTIGYEYESLNNLDYTHKMVII